MSEFEDYAVRYLSSKEIDASTTDSPLRRGADIAKKSVLLEVMRGVLAYLRENLSLEIPVRPELFFEEPGTMNALAQLAIDIDEEDPFVEWFARIGSRLASSLWRSTVEAEPEILYDRIRSSELLLKALVAARDEEPEEHYVWVTEALEQCSAEFSDAKARIVELSLVGEVGGPFLDTKWERVSRLSTTAWFRRLEQLGGRPADDVLAKVA